MPLLPWIIGGALIGGLASAVFSADDDDFDEDDRDEDDWDADRVYRRVLAWSIAGVVFGLSKRSFSINHKKDLKAKLVNCGMSPSSADNLVGLLPPVPSGKISEIVNEYQRRSGVEERIKMASLVLYMSAIAGAGESGWSQRKKSTFACISKRLKVPSDMQQEIIDNTRIHYLCEKYRATPKGTGFFVNCEGGAITCEHVAKGTAKNYIFWKNNFHKADVEFTNKSLDYSFLSIHKIKKSPSLFLSPKKPKLAQDVYIYGFPETKLNGYDVNVTKGIVASETGMTGNQSTFRIDAVIHGGNSGGPVVSTDDGSVIGIAAHGTTDVHNFAIKGDCIYKGIRGKVSLKQDALDKNFQEAVFLVLEEKSSGEDLDLLTKSQILERYEQASHKEKWRIFSYFQDKGWDLRPIITKQSRQHGGLGEHIKNFFSAFFL